MPTLCRITVYPLKSFDGHDLSACKVLAGGALAKDRRYALVDGLGRYVNGKRCAAIQGIRATFSEDLKQVTLSCEGQESSFEIAAEQESLAAWCGEVLGVKCRLVENAEAGFPDDAVSPGPTVVSTASLEAVTAWFAGLDLTETRRRFRFNLELSDAPEFWEDGLVPPLRKTRRFRMGDLVWQGRGVCERCVVPTRDSCDSSATAGFAREFARLREQTLPDWAVRERFEHFYRLGVNTELDSSENEPGESIDVVRVGDPVELIG